LDEGEEVTRTTTLNLPTPPLPPGSIFAARYQIIEELGKGGMGRVYRAWDRKLDEEIAIKFIKPGLTEDPAAVERFRIELKAARQVIHKNVARMFDLNEADGVPFITMEYVKGGDLKALIKKMGRLDAQQAVRIVRQVAEGLAEAHRTGVLHRDLKPHNIMVDEEGTARITDFGLARLRKTDDATLTAPGMGTPAYASPEQVEGTAVDNRSDLYSLGIVLYEMLTGKIPFKGDSPYSVALQRLTKTPPDPRRINPEIPEALVQVIMKCLEKEREKRYQSAEELISDLDAFGNGFLTGSLAVPEPGPIGKQVWRWVLARPIPLAILAVVILVVLGSVLLRPRSPWKTSIAVLPVVDLRPQEHRSSLWYGLRSGISAKLTNIPELRVAAIRNSSDDDYSGKTYREIGKELSADYLLEMTLQDVGTRLQVGVELIEAKSNSVIRTNSYEPEIEGIYSCQDAISIETARALKVTLGDERLKTFKKRETENLEAYSCYLEGKRLLEEEYHRTNRLEDFTRAVSMYEKATEIDPKYALAYWELGNAYEERYYFMASKGVKDPANLQKMTFYYFQAYNIEPDFAEANLGVGWIHFNLKDNARASQCFKRAFDLDPNNFNVNRDVGAFLRSVGLYDEAIKYLSRAAEVDPHSITTRNLISSSLLWLGESEKALLEIDKAIEVDPRNFEARYHRATALILAKRLNEAQKEIDLTREIIPQRTMTLPQALLWAAEGKKGKALELISGENALNTNITGVYILLGLKEEAIRCIEQGIESGFEDQGNYLYPYPMLARNPLFKPLKGERGFQEILQREKAKYEETLKEFPKF
jgi:serine/threonine protein kinase/tetratricopeptide (TPR) repeat protein